MDRLEAPISEWGVVRVVGVELGRGEAIGLGQASDWPVTFDETTGWICVGDSRAKLEAGIRVYPGTTLAIASEQLLAVWLQPHMDE